MIRPRFLLLSASVVAVLAAALWIGASGVRADGADFVRWDIINITVPFNATPPHNDNQLGWCGIRTG
ncbi:MAG: hypothetical protein DMG57_19855 [Acidobacteria bacterium]|nr:MAG: hypothetical protein DMG57_19855 [Acidobacteriota bacterium]